MAQRPAQGSLSDFDGGCLPGNLAHKLSLMDRTQMPNSNEKAPMTKPKMSSTGPYLSMTTMEHRQDVM